MPDRASRSSETRYNDCVCRIGLPDPQRPVVIRKYGSIPLFEVCQALNACVPNAACALEAKGEGIRQSIEWLEVHGF